MALPNIYVLEGFTWCGVSPPDNIALFLSRYNMPQASGGSNIVAGGGRFSGNALTLAGGFIFQQLELPGGPYAPAIRFGVAVKSTNWKTPGTLLAFGDSGSGLAGNHQNVYVACGLNLSGKMCIMIQPINQFTNQGVIVATGTKNLLNNSYYFIELELINVSATVGVANVYIDGVLEATYTGNTTGGGAPSGNVYSVYMNCPQAGGTFSFCDAYVSDTLLGPLHNVDATPTSDGALSQWTPSIAGPHFSLVNEEPPDGDTTYVLSSTPGNIDLYGFPALAGSPAAILGVQVAFYARKDDLAARTIAPEVRSGGTNFVGTTQPALTTTYQDIYLQVYNADPKTSAAWLPAGLNAAQFGVNLIS